MIPDTGGVSRLYEICGSGVVSDLVLTGRAMDAQEALAHGIVSRVVDREDLPTAISQNQARHHIASLLGGPLGGVLYAVARPLPFLVDAVTFAVSLLTVSRVRTDLSPVDRPRGTPVRELGDGLRYLLARPYFRSVAAFGAACNLVVNAVFFVAIVRLVEDGVPSTTIGLFQWPEPASRCPTTAPVVGRYTTIPPPGP